MTQVFDIAVSTSSQTNVVIRAPFYSLSGYGAHVRDLIEALTLDPQLSVYLLPTVWGESSELFSNKDMQDLPSALQLLPFYNSQFPLSEAVFIHIGLPSEFERLGKVNIGVTAGLETTAIPDAWLEGLKNIDLLIVPSSFVMQVFLSSGAEVPITVIGEGVKTDKFFPETDKSSFKILDNLPEFTFLYSGQWLHANRPAADRKNVEMLIRCYCEAFSGRQDVGLLLKTHFLNYSSIDKFEVLKALARIVKSYTDPPPVFLLHGVLSDDELRHLYNHPSIKAFVSCTAGEGWGRTSAEAIACDLPVLITGWSGHMDYIDSSYSTTFLYDLVDIDTALYQYPWFRPGMKWAHPKKDDVIRKLQRVNESYKFSKDRAVIYGKIFRENFESKKCYSALVELIKARSK